jgi:hypothetical protein
VSAELFSPLAPGCRVPAELFSHLAPDLLQ